MSTNEKWHRLGHLWREGAASDSVVVAFAVVLAVAWSSALVLGLTPSPESAQQKDLPNADVTWPD